MKSNSLERKIIKSTKEKNYEKSKEILIKEYEKQFKKMLKYKKIKCLKTWYFYDYIINVNEAYSSLFKSDLDEMIEVLYSQKSSIKNQISWLIDNCEVFNFYKL